jgi:hypothetical protein
VPSKSVIFQEIALFDYILNAEEIITNSGKKLKIIRIQNLREFLLIEQLKAEYSKMEIDELNKEEIMEIVSIIRRWVERCGFVIRTDYFSETGIITVEVDENALREAKERFLKVLSEAYKDEEWPR